MGAYRDHRPHGPPHRRVVTAHRRGRRPRKGPAGSPGRPTRPSCRRPRGGSMVVAGRTSTRRGEAATHRAPRNPDPREADGPSRLLRLPGTACSASRTVFSGAHGPDEAHEGSGTAGDRYRSRVHCRPGRPARTSADGPFPRAERLPFRARTAHDDGRSPRSSTHPGAPACSARSRRCAPAEVRSVRGVVLLAHHDDRAGRVLGAALADRAQHRPGEPAPSTAAHDEDLRTP